MKELKCLLSILLSLSIILSNINACFAVWRTTRNKVNDFIKGEGITFSGILTDDVIEIIYNAKGHSSLIDFLLYLDESKKDDVIRFVREDLGCQNIDEEDVIKFMRGAAGKFCEDHKLQIDALKSGKGSDDALLGSLWNSEWLHKEKSVKKLFVYVVMLETRKLCGSDTAFVIRQINDLLGNVITAIKAHDKDTKKISDTDKEILGLAERVSALEVEQCIVDCRLDMHDRQFVEVNSRLDEHDRQLADLREQVNLLERRVVNLERLENGLFADVSEITVRIYEDLSREGTVNNQDFQTLLGLLDKVYNEISENNKLSARLGQLSSRFNGIEKFVAEKLAKSVDALQTNVESLNQSSIRYSGAITELQRQREGMKEDIEKVLDEFSAFKSDYKAAIDGYAKGAVGEIFEGREKALVEEYMRSNVMKQCILKYVHPELGRKML